jgi:3-oxoacyl-[acyl-carrier protein] reductase
MSDELDFSGKVALVTGASRGIGAGIITALGQRGARCIVNYVSDPDGRNEADARAVAAALADARIVQADVGSVSEVAALAQFVRDSFGGLDILVNNAGILRERTLKKMTGDDWELPLRINLTGTFNCIRSLLELIRPDGRIVNISSVSGSVGLFGHAGYATSKAGIVALTKVAARELARNRITVNAVAPGFIQTEMTRSMPQAAVQKITEQIPLGCWGNVQDVVGVVLFLCSPLARYITGQTIHVNGGYYMGG